jgi:predicted negative regulator of RcsB-dependent stress response
VQGFEPLVWDMRGNILLAQDDKQGAAKAYQEAFQLINKNDALYGILELKLAALMALPEAAVTAIHNESVLVQ